jgi:hypothetical protein
MPGFKDPVQRPGWKHTLFPRDPSMDLRAIMGVVQRQALMALTISIVLAGALIVWLAFFYFARSWPLKVAKHKVFCPVQKRAAEVSFVHSEVSVGAYMPTDVSSCSLFPRGEMSCDKECMK